ncbi:MAG: molybdopterin-binding protein [Chloroflexota bacterium]|nr:molybdopterin-binding protein [Chloroflexota bacterium]MDE2948803.1 molybdopterin-binding protein [Chloroflexota bacterium]
MKFGELPVEEAVGAILAHKLYDNSGKLIFNKGHLLGEADLEALSQEGLERVTVTQLSAADLHEDAAAERIGAAVAGAHVSMRAPGVGRANLTAAQRGVLHVDVPRLEWINNIYDGITIATLRQYSLVDAGDMVALVKVVPFGVPAARVVDVERIAEASAAVLRVRPLQRKRVALIVSGTDATRGRLMKSFQEPVRRRIEGWGSEMLEPSFTEHSAESIAAAIQAQVAAKADMILVAGISAIIDREDVVPSALTLAGGSITLHGVPVDPGTLLMMGYLGDAPVVGAPGCIKSPKTNVIDWILPRLLSGERLTRANLVSMGHGGLLQDIAERPMPRSVTNQPHPPARRRADDVGPTR